MKDVEFLKQHNVDVDKSLELFGDMETYNDTIKEFQEGIPKKIAEIEKYYKDKDMKNYAIYVHSLKSDCKYFGFTELADLAYEHELAGKANYQECSGQNSGGSQREAEESTGGNRAG